MWWLEESLESPVDAPIGLMELDDLDTIIQYSMTKNVIGSIGKVLHW